ncbi:MAG: hypothetical protein LBI48_00725 [Burkholderiaceae bacterium]|nr:hypothetical protein [Burkholderiaceae bacterium]
MTKTLTAHGRALVLCSWLAALSYSLPAAAQGIAAARLSDGLKQYDLAFVGWCILVAVIGGFGRTVLTLLSPDVAVLSVLREAWRDLLIAALAGAAAAVILYAIHSTGVNLPVPVDVLILAASGWARMGFFVWAGDGARILADRGVQWAANKFGGRPPYGELYPGPRWDNTHIPQPAPPSPSRVDNPDQMP